MAKKISMKDIAQELGVSVALVSYVLNRKFSNRISVDTAEKIRKLAKKYNYTPNQIAKSLKNNKTYTIGLIVADISNLFYSEISRHIEEEAQSLGYNVVFASAYEDPNRFESIVDVFLSKQVDGLILAVPEGADKYLSKVEQSGIPYVSIDREFENIDPSKIINIDNYKASASVVQHLHENGFKKPCAIALKSNLNHLVARKKGFTETINLNYNAEALLSEISERTLEEEIEGVILKAIKEDKADAIYFLTNRIAMAGLAVLAKNNIAVPESVGVVCFDEAEAYKIFNTNLTYVKQPLIEMGVAAVQKIINQKSNNQNLKFSTTLIIKESTILS